MLVIGNCLIKNNLFGTFQRRRQNQQLCNRGITCQYTTQKATITQFQQTESDQPMTIIQTEQSVMRKTKAKEFAIDMAREAWATKAEEVRVVDVEDAVKWTTYFVFITVFSRPQLDAILGKMAKRAKGHWEMEDTQKQSGRSAWEVLDFGDVVIHAFSQQLREYYNLEAKFEECEEVQLDFKKQEEEAQEEQQQPKWTIKQF
eukprot:TRINITY_DN10783_c0_g1_i9.p1 TRINITY_DN10783_c0_g1~~TRINITY_DN10783_c0_g1_i9.p1  ORF type:complete len:202 (-),score=30.91 TRINITY_DN10783_c0_g1_i9:217-822(-)